MEILLAATAMGIAIVVLLLLAGRLRPEARAGARGPARKGSKPGLAKTGPSGAARSCPLCGASLAPGERIHSDITPGKGDRIMGEYVNGPVFNIIAWATVVIVLGLTVIMWFSTNEPKPYDV